MNRSINIKWFIHIQLSVNKYQPGFAERVSFLLPVIKKKGGGGVGFNTFLKEETNTRGNTGARKDWLKGKSSKYLSSYEKCICSFL